MGVVLLLVRAVLVAYKVGMVGTPWLFFVIILVYLGGIMVLFLYTLRISKPSKVILSNPGRLFLVIALIFISDLLFGVLDMGGFGSKIRTGFFSGRSPIITFLVLYLFIALLAVMKLSETTQGPIKNS